MHWNCTAQFTQMLPSGSQATVGLCSDAELSAGITGGGWE
jgi:hypothetical protein